MSLTFANKITVCRIIAVPFFISAVLCYSPDKDYLRYVALGIFLFAVISDIIDGYIARTRHQKTQAGAILDPLADKLLLISAYGFIYKMRHVFPAISFPVWLVVAVISRDIILLLGSMIIQVWKGKLNIEPTIFGKSAAFFQITSVIGVLLQWSYSVILWPFMLALTLISGIDYIRKGIKLINS